MRADRSIRIGHAERRSAVADLQRHFTAGHVDVAELRERTIAAYAATTAAQLTCLFADLPTGGPAGRRGTPTRLGVAAMQILVPVGVGRWCEGRAELAHAQLMMWPIAASAGPWLGGWAVALGALWPIVDGVVLLCRRPVSSCARRSGRAGPARARRGRGARRTSP